MVIVYKKWKKYNEIQLTKNKMDLNIRKMTKNQPSPELLNNQRINYCFNMKLFITCTVFMILRMNNIAAICD